MAKAKSAKRSGIIDTISSYFTPDKGTVIDKLKNRKRDINKAVEPKMKAKAKVGGYKSGSNAKIKEGEDKLKKKSKAEIEAIRKKLQAGKKVKAN